MHARNCVFRGGDGLTAVVVLFPAGDGVLVEAGSSLHADRCDFSGGNDSTGLGFVESGYALRSGGDVGLFQCTCRGGGPVPGVAGAGADAVIADGGTMRISGDAAAVIQGGTAVTGASASDAAWSGLAIRVNGGSVAVHDSVSLLPATVGAVVTAGPVSTGNAALPFFSADGTTLPSGETDAASSVVMTLQSGLPNQPYAFVVGFRAARTSDPALLGDLWIDLSSSAMLFGALDATGSFSIGFTPEDLFGGLYGFPFFAQVAVLDGALNIRMSNCDARIYDL